MAIQRKVYQGAPLESGGTSIQGKASPAVRQLVKKGEVKQGMVVLDFGAGKYGRNAKYLREQGVKVYAYDPYNGIDRDGWSGVSNVLPTEKNFDLVITSFVLNVVPEYIQKEILSTVEQFSNNHIHITRNLDVYESVNKALKRKDKVVSEFFLTHFADRDQCIRFSQQTLTEQDVLDFVHFGVQTSKGFQRIPQLDRNKFNLIQRTNSFKVFKRITHNENI